MSEHTPQHHDSARPVDPTGSNPTLIDLVAGDPPVPITVWRTARTDTDAGSSLGTPLAYRLVAAYSRPGEAVVDLTTDHALTTACSAGRRRHHPAWFTDTDGLVIGATSVADETLEAASGGGEPPDLRAWFGDDLTDPDLPPFPEPRTPPTDETSTRALTSLVVATWPLDTADAANRVKLAWLLATCARLLRPGGCLVLVVASTHPWPEDFSHVAHAAAAAGLGYLQHIVAVTADTDGDAFVYHVTDEELLTLAADNGAERQRSMAHLHVHADLLVFSQAQVSERTRRPRQGGGRHG
jgi:SAM-dependent methyltransferase